MCGRYTLTQDVDRYAEYFGVEEVRTESLAPSYNVAPTDEVYAVAEHEGQRQLGTFRWGLLPFWARDRRSININARVETITEKSVFKESFTRRRCLIPADGFYEWERLDQGKLPHYIWLESGEPMGLAGIWSTWRDHETGERLRTSAIITIEPNDLVGALHDRMPALISPDDWGQWLDPANEDLDGLLRLVNSPPSQAMTEHAVSSLVNSVKNNVPELIDPLVRG